MLLALSWMRCERCTCVLCAHEMHCPRTHVFWVFVPTCVPVCVCIYVWCVCSWVWYMCIMCIVCVVVCMCSGVCDVCTCMWYRYACILCVLFVLCVCGKCMVCVHLYVVCTWCVLMYTCGCVVYFVVWWVWCSVNVLCVASVSVCGIMCGV